MNTIVTKSETAGAVVENIYLIAKAQGLQIGTLENNIGIQRGYFSRKRNGGSLTDKILADAAKQLDVSVDYLINEMPENDRKAYIKAIEERQIVANAGIIADKYHVSIEKAYEMLAGRPMTTKEKAYIK